MIENIDEPLLVGFEVVRSWTWSLGFHFKHRPSISVKDREVGYPLLIRAIVLKDDRVWE